MTQITKLTISCNLNSEWSGIMNSQYLQSHDKSPMILFRHPSLWCAGGLCNSRSREQLGAEPHNRHLLLLLLLLLLHLLLLLLLKLLLLLLALR